MHHQQIYTVVNFARQYTHLFLLFFSSSQELNNSHQKHKANSKRYFSPVNRKMQCSTSNLIETLSALGNEFERLRCCPTPPLGVHFAKYKFLVQVNFLKTRALCCSKMRSFINAGFLITLWPTLNININ